MKRQYNFLKMMIATALLFGSMNAAQSQVNGFTLTCPGGVQNAGTSFPMNVSFNWTNSTTSATAVINYNPALVNYDAS